MFNFLMYVDDTTLYFNFEDFPVENPSMLIMDKLEELIAG